MILDDLEQAGRQRDRVDVDFAAADRAAYTMYCHERLDEAGGWSIAQATGDGDPPVVVVVRAPDHANDVEAFAGDGAPVVLSVDLGSQFDGVADDAEQFAAWRTDMQAAYDASGLPREHPAFAVYMDAVATADPERVG